MLGQPNLPNRCRVSCQRQLPLARQQWHWTWQRSLLTQTESGWIFTDLWISLFFVQRCHTAETFSEFSCSTEGKGKGTRKERERERHNNWRDTQIHLSHFTSLHILLLRPTVTSWSIHAPPTSETSLEVVFSVDEVRSRKRSKKAIQHFCCNSASRWQFVSKSRRLRCTACLCGQAKYSVTRNAAKKITIKQETRDYEGPFVTYFTFMLIFVQVKTCHISAQSHWRGSLRIVGHLQQWSAWPAWSETCMYNTTMMCMHLSWPCPQAQQMHLRQEFATGWELSKF